MKDIGIDLGTANVLIFVKGQGIVLNEPSVVAVDLDSNKVLAVGKEALEMLGRTPGKIKAIKPLKEGVIADFEYTEIMLNKLIKSIRAKGLFTRPRILICCPSNITKVEKNALKETAERLGAKKVYIEEEPKVAAIGSGLDISKAHGSMVIDIGGGTTDIAILSLGEIVTSESIKIAGNTFDKKIVDYLKEKYNLLIGERTAENIKLLIGCVYNGNKNNELEVKGRSITKGLPTSIKINEKELEEVLYPTAMEIINLAKSVLEKTSPELSSDIVENGIVITGGTSLLKGFDELFEENLQIPIIKVDNPLFSVVEGAGIMISNLDYLDK